MFRFLASLFLLSFSFVHNLNAIGQQLANYIGTGSNPRIQLELSSTNGPGWGSYTIDYQGVGNVPYSSDPTKTWSPWNVKDTDGNYYGTITLKSDGNTVTFDKYVANDGFYLEGIVLSYNNGNNAYQLTVSAIHGGGSSGPFPDAPLATPAVYAGTSEPIIFSVSGTQMVNNKGSHVYLKGMVRPSLEWNPQGQNLSVTDLQKIRDWGSNVIRLNLNQNYWFDSAPVTQYGSYKQIIDAIIYYSTQLGMAVILDLHWTENGHQNPMANKQSLVFW